MLRASRRTTILASVGCHGAVGELLEFAQLPPAPIPRSPRARSEEVLGRGDKPGGSSAAFDSDNR